MEAHFESLPETTKGTLERLRGAKFLDQFYLAGGTGLALQIGHRISRDLDFFTEKNFMENIVMQELQKLGELAVEQRAPQTINGILNSTKISFLGYSYPLLKPLRNIAGVVVADIIDIACMKIEAVASRGTKRDFIDIYCMAQEGLSLKEILQYFEVKYAALQYNMLHIRKSLVYFDDAENDPMPNMIKPVEWPAVKKFFQKEARGVFSNQAISPK